MKVTVLAENTASRTDIGYEHGLSLYIETDSHKILFDMGQSDLFCRNALTLGIDLSRIDIAVLSHGHYDHGGGIGAFRTRNQTAPLYCSPHAFGDFHSDHYIGLPDTVRHDPRLFPAIGTTVLDKGITLYADCPIPLDSNVAKGLWKYENGTPCPDGFCHEIYLVIEEKGKKALFSGCAHKGITGIAAHFSPDILIGGFHFKNINVQENELYLCECAHRLLSQNTIYYTCHCTGTPAFSFLKEKMKDKLYYLAGGETIIL